MEWMTSAFTLCQEGSSSYENSRRRHPFSYQFPRKETVTDIVNTYIGWQ